MSSQSCKFIRDSVTIFYLVSSVCHGNLTSPWVFVFGKFQLGREMTPSCFCDKMAISIGSRAETRKNNWIANFLSDTKWQHLSKVVALLQHLYKPIQVMGGEEWFIETAVCHPQISKIGLKFLCDYGSALNLTPATRVFPREIPLLSSLETVAMS